MNFSGLHVTSNFAANYEEDGKTKVHIMNNDSEFGLMINGYSQVPAYILFNIYFTSNFFNFKTGFRLNNDMSVLGPMAIFPRTVLSWNVGNFKDVTEESLSLFALLEPKLDILVLGTGDRSNDTTLFTTCIKFMRKHKVNIEILPTEQAVSTFNFLNSEGRYVGGALIPPETITTTEDDLLSTKMKYKELYEYPD